MKNTIKRVMALGAAAALAAGMLAGCGGNGNSTAGSTAGSGSSAGQEITTLTWYMSINPVAADTDKVIEALNEYTREKIGVEMPICRCAYEVLYQDRPVRDVVDELMQRQRRGEVDESWIRG